MQSPGPSLGSPAVVGQRSEPVYCFVGVVKLTRSAPGTESGPLAGQLHTSVGVGVPLVQSVPIRFGNNPLTAVDQQVATCCGHLLFHDGRLALDVAFASPGVHTTTPGVSPLALTALALLGLLPTCS